MDQVIVFDKSLQERLSEFTAVLSPYEHKVLPVSAISKQWSNYLELTVDPIGWQAIWKIPRCTCEALNIPFPSIVLVFVLDVDFQELLAMVRVIAVQDDISIPDINHVQLIQLWPTKDQDKSIGLDLEKTSNALDMVRFFYLHVLMPWDMEEDDTYDWKNKHLESRLRLYYDMKNGTIPRATGEHLHSLLTEAKRLQVKREAIEVQMGEDDSDIEANSTKNAGVEKLMQIHLRLLEIRSQVEILENPLLRKALIQRQNDFFGCKTKDKQHFWLIFNEGKAQDYVRFLEIVQVHYPKELLTFAPDLAAKLETANAKDVFILNESRHVIRTTGALENGGVLRGLGDKTKITLTSAIEDVMLDFIGESVLLENITIDASSAQCGILVRAGKGVLKNCKVMGNRTRSTHQGIIVLARAQLELIDCEVTGFCTAIVGNSGSKILLKNTEIHNVDFGLKAFDDCVVKIQQSTVHDCSNYGIVVETENNYDGDSGKKIGNFDTLNIIPEITAECVDGRNNAKGDVIINQKVKIKAIGDLFQNDLDPTIYRNDSDEMETNGFNDLDETVVPQRNISPITI